MKKKSLLFSFFLGCVLSWGNSVAQEKRVTIVTRGMSFVSLEERQQTNGEAISPERTTGNISFRYAAAKAVPGVVHIIATYQPGFKEEEVDSSLDLSVSSLHPTVTTGSASGVIITPDGYIVTNYHVVHKSASIKVILANQNTFKAEVVGMDALTDIALLKINAQQLPFIRFGSLDDVAVGDWVLAIGSPLGMTSTVTAGIISMKSRVFTDQEDQGSLSSFIQTDAVMNGGNSGGALVDINGKLIGVNIAILTPTGNFAGYSFAIPVEVVKKVCNDLLRNGQALHASLGVYVANVPEKYGVYVYKLLEGSPAVKAGIQMMDVITEIDNREIQRVGDMQQVMILHHPGDKILLKILRKGKLVNCDAILK
ncbi:MAG: trypsin-like peptidase domain-containing protein [Chitinophaga sp.]|uniref:S1C family serine protease n=1 Tax=Chitinophaga sp. TaxID=1869181 RepID=UPI001B0426A8|nr:trypsin-like peptidase domain-containing protein [Chitinophaga sp.]MBO9729691.1 trypsin-like peptidase domain-containing protein [Chitinophaga sp.]